MAQDESQRARSRPDRILESFMNCDDFDQWFDRTFDARPSLMDGPGAELEAHLATCDRCRGAWAGAQVLHQAIKSWSPPPLASSASIDRLRALRVPEPVQRRRGPSRLFKVGLPLSAVAASLLIWLGHESTRLQVRELEQRSTPLKLVAVRSPRPLGQALEEATRATLDMARDASAPVARIGREVLIFENKALESPDPAEEEFGSPSLSPGLIESLGKSVNAGVKPLSGSARHAFSFLLGPTAPADTR